ncbi:Transcriptional repressor SmtB [Thermoflexales bacterium]|nr:Transcriptional repressor SmtB [Thermoflexales bacterium]
MQKPQKLEIQLLQAEICQALADPTRIMLLYLLAAGAKNVGDLGATLEASQPTVSRHLKVLRERGMVTAERLGTTVNYSLADRRVIEALDLLRAVMTDNLLQKTALVDLLNQA